jgi:hypothetical protein
MFFFSLWGRKTGTGTERCPLVTWLDLFIVCRPPFWFLIVCMFRLESLSLMSNRFLYVEGSWIALVAEVLVGSVLCSLNADTSSVLPYGTSITENGESVVLFESTDAYCQRGPITGLHRIIPLSSGDSGTPRDDSLSPFMLCRMTSAWSASAMGPLPSGIVFLSTSDSLISL